MAQTVPLDSAYIRAQAKNCEDQYWQHGTITAVRNCPFSAEVHGGNSVGVTAVRGDCALACFQPAAAVDCLPMVEEHHQSKCAVAEQTHVQSVRASIRGRIIEGLQARPTLPSVVHTDDDERGCSSRVSYSSSYSRLFEPPQPMSSSSSNNHHHHHQPAAAAVDGRWSNRVLSVSALLPLYL
jgi:hypothetical protein